MTSQRIRICSSVDDQAGMSNESFNGDCEQHCCTRGGGKAHPAASRCVFLVKGFAAVVGSGTRNETTKYIVASSALTK